MKKTPVAKAGGGKKKNVNNNKNNKGKKEEDSFRCDDCAMVFPTEQHLQEHFGGKKHKRKIAEKEAVEEAMKQPRRLHRDIANESAEHSGWVLKSTRHFDDASKITLENRWMEVKGGYLTYSLERGMKSKGFINLAGVVVERCALLPPNYELEEESEKGTQPPTPGMTPNMFPCEGLSPMPFDMPSPGINQPSEFTLGESLNDKLGLFGREPSLRSAPEFTLQISGGSLGRDLHLVMASMEELVEWRESLHRAVRKAAEKEEDDEKLAKDNEALYEAEQQHPGYKKPELQDFELQTTIGRGSFGKVMKVVHRLDGKTYALKTLAKDAILKDSIIDKVRGERQSLADISHPFLSSLQYAFQTPDKLYLVMHYFPGGDLKFHLKSRNVFKEPMAAFYTAQLVMALGYLHSKSILYRDLKPANIVINSDGYAVLTDFGMAKRCARKRTSSFCGTDIYMAPEIIAEREYGVAVDWWSLGILVYEMLVGKPPFDSDDPCQLYDMITDNEVKYPSVLSPHARSFLQKTLCKDEQKRLCEMDEVQKQSFFSSIDFKKLLAKELPPPFKPNLEKSDTRYFDTRFTNERPVISKCKAVPGSKQQAFTGFSYPRLSCS
eukprot:TRINITY_DN2553_c0_g1_i1.p1 TRINITY_DN2553_c0_g1~~TRINITY_DN2553_c0_g1_i1.p1  ORF type:complete len:608 (+),score=113.31 TRINITY_DN2553_c0_g1_i1:99-1922(+)